VHTSECDVILTVDLSVTMSVSCGLYLLFPASLPSVNQEKTNEVVNEGNELKKECVEVKNDEEDVELKKDVGYAEEVKNEVVEADIKCLVSKTLDYRRLLV